MYTHTCTDCNIRLTLQEGVIMKLLVIDQGAFMAYDNVNAAVHLEIANSCTKFNVKAISQSVEAIFVYSISLIT